jgi:microcompartment protein CcmL/EutN
MDENAELLEAVVAGDVDRVKAALAKGADVTREQRQHGSQGA